MKLSKKQSAVLALCVTALMLALLGVVTRVMNEGVGPFTQVYSRIGGAFLLALLLFYKKINFKKFKTLPKKDWILLTIIGTVGYGIAVIFVTFSILNTTLLNASVIASTVPFFALIYTAIITKKFIPLTLLGFLILSFIGVYLITTKSFSFVIHSFGIGEVYALLFAAGGGAYVVARKYLSSKLSNIEISVAVLFIAFISSFLSALLIGEKLNFAGFFDPYVFMALISGIIFNVLGTRFQIFGFGQLSAVVGSQILLLQNIFSPIFGIILYNEKLIPIEFLGAVLILIGVFGYYKKAEN